MRLPSILLAVTVATGVGAFDSSYNDDGIAAIQTQTTAIRQQQAPRMYDEDEEEDALETEAEMHPDHTGKRAFYMGLDAKEADPFTLQLNNTRDLIYTANVMVGGQEVRALFATHTAEFFVFSKECKSDFCKNNTHFYDPALANQMGRHPEIAAMPVPLLWGDTVSKLITDTVWMNGVPRNQSLFEVLDAQSPAVNSGLVDGVVGLAHPVSRVDLSRTVEWDIKTVEACNRAPGNCPRWLYLKANEDLAVKALSDERPPLLQNFKIVRYSLCYKQGSGTNGVLRMNDAFPDMPDVGRIKSVFREIKLEDPYVWKAALSKVKVKSQDNPFELSCSNTSSDCSAIVTNEFGMIAAPRAVVDKLHSEIVKRGWNKGPCTAHPMGRLVFKLGGQKIVLPPRAFMGTVDGKLPAAMKAVFPHLQDVTGPTCSLMIAALDQSPGKELWYFGIPFLREYYTTFNFGSDPAYSTATMATPRLFVARSDGECRKPETFASRLTLKHDEDLIEERTPEEGEVVEQVNEPSLEDEEELELEAGIRILMEKGGQRVGPKAFRLEDFHVPAWMMQSQSPIKK